MKIRISAESTNSKLLFMEILAAAVHGNSGLLFMEILAAAVHGNSGLLFMEILGCSLLRFADSNLINQFTFCRFGPAQEKFSPQRIVDSVKSAKRLCAVIDPIRGC
jgi:hypothetical protein